MISKRSFVLFIATADADADADADDADADADASSVAAHSISVVHLLGFKGGEGCTHHELRLVDTDTRVWVGLETVASVLCGR